MKFTIEEVDNLKRLFASDIEENFILGLSLLEQQREYVSELLPIVVWKFRFYEDIFDSSYASNQEKQFLKRLAALLADFANEETYMAYSDALDLFFALPWKYQWEQIVPILEFYEDYRTDFEADLLISAGFVKNYAVLGARLKKLERYHESRLFLKPAVESGLATMGQKIDYCNTLCLGHFAKGRYHEEVPFVIKVMEEAVQVYPRFANQYYTQIALMYQIYLNDKQMALEYNYKSHELSQSYSVNLNNLAWLQFEYEKNWPEAYVNAKLAVSLSQENPSANFCNTLACLEMYYKKDFPKAEALFLQSLEIDKAHHYSYLKLGLLYHQMGQKKEAEAMLTKAYELNKKDEETLWELLQFYADFEENREDALKYGHQLLEIAPDHKEAATVLDQLNAFNP